jgi:hypothetical protein
MISGRLEQADVLPLFSNQRSRRSRATLVESAQNAADSPAHRCAARRSVFVPLGIAPLLLALLSADPLAAASAEAVTPDLAGFVARLARPTPASTAYTEVRFLHVLRRPLVLHGQLDYHGTGQLGKRVDAPFHETMTIADGVVRVTREDRAPKQFELERAPDLNALLTGFSALLGGDATGLQALYTINLVNNAPNWTLTLTPRSPALARHLRAVVVDGRANDPDCFTLQQADGDRSVMLLGALAATQLSEPPTAAALAALCHSAP